MTQVELSYNSLDKVIHMILDRKHPVLLRGPHGIGKSEYVRQVAKKRNKQVVSRRASQMTEGDLLGLPVVSGNTTSWNPPDWFKECCDHPRVLFMDEIDRATMEVRQGFFEMTDSRCLNGHHLHPETEIIAAVNGGQHGEHYQVGEMDPAESDRWTVFDLSPTVEDWINWGRQTDDNGQQNIHAMILNFIGANTHELEHKSKNGFEPGSVYPSRRSWKRLNDTMVQNGFFENEETLPLIISLASAYVGTPVATRLHDFVKKEGLQVSPEDVIMKGKISLTEKFTLPEHCALIDKMVNKEMFNKKLTKKQIENFCEYFGTLPSEAAMKLWHSYGSCTVEENIVAAHRQKLKDGRSVGVIVAEFMTAAEEKKPEEK